MITDTERLATAAEQQIELLRAAAEREAARAAQADEAAERERVAVAAARERQLAAYEASVRATDRLAVATLAAALVGPGCDVYGAVRIAELALRVRLADGEGGR